MKSFFSISILLFFSLFFSIAFGQTTNDKINTYLTEKGFTTKDIQNWKITDQYTSKTSGVENIYIRQTYQDIEIYNAVANFHFKDDNLLTAGIRLEKDIAKKVNTTSATLSPIEAIQAAANALGLTPPTNLKITEAISSKHFIIDGSEISLEPIPVQLMLLSTNNEEEEIRLVWDMSIYERSKDHWWSLRVDALTGEILDQIDWVVSCTFESCNHSKFEHTTRRDIPKMMPAPTPAPPPGTDAYRVFALPAESPNHAPRTLVVGPSDPIASPYGWHDDNGLAGAEYLTTQGNNVRATEDANDNNGTGYFPNGGASLNFDFPLNFNNAPTTNWDPVITNLFYMNNIMHDVWYQYGFDEVSGNFQENAYGNGGAASDMVFAEAQDGGGTNNANFATPADGGNPRMQMYLWDAGTGNYLLTVNSPTGIAGQYFAEEATFGPGLPATPITGNFVLVNDGTALPDEGCSPLINGTAINGNIAIVMRGTCGFTDKVISAQNAGATAVIVINNAAGAPFAMGGTLTSITIPSIMISDVDGALILAQLSGGVNGTLQSAGTAQAIDGDFDNGIIAHEYGHGISNRLTGGPAAAGCLSNDEQMGEGWSDWFGLMLTIEPGDVATDSRGIGTFATAEPITGNGIRPTPYSIDFAVNGSTYATTNNTGSISQPHGIGYVWCTMLWDLNWALINQYGFDPDVYNGTGGNNIAMHLVIEGLKLQACSPGFVDGRDGILAADMALYGGANQCLIWEVFANRGLGFSATQGSSNSRTDQVEAFDLPTQCQTPTQAPIANYGYASVGCDGTFSFTDASTQIAQQWLWNFGDGTTSTLPNPTHQYAANGTYIVTLTASNIIGSDITTQSLTVSMSTPPVVANQSICANNSTSLSATATDSVIWFDASGTVALDTTSTFTTPVLTTTTTYMTQNVALEPILSVGPANASFGTSGYHDPAADFTLNFTSSSANGFTILSAWVDAGSTGTRTINVWDAADANGTIVGSATVNITTTGAQRIPININVLTPGNYSIGGTGFDMRRNNNGAAYPFTLPGIVSITGSSAGASSQYYYYLYDWEVQEIACRSAMVPVTVSVAPSDSTTETVSNCGAYTWPVTGMNYSTTGSYLHTSTNSAGCDSIITLDLTIHSGSIDNQTMSACNTYTWPADGSTLTTSGQYSVIFSDVNGCDSIINLDLTITQQNLATETVNSCSPYTWTADGNTYASSGTYTTTITNTVGCDSLLTLNLTVGTPYSTTQTVTACDNYTWSENGITYVSSGSFNVLYTNSTGCDSLITLNLTMNQGSTETFTETACGEYTWPINGQNYNTSGNYSVVYTNSIGCDSIINLNLTVNNVNANVTQTSDISLQSNSTTASYQWVDCNNNYAPIAGETNQTFTATNNGSYAVIVSQNGCTDTSSCYLISKVGIVENDFGDLFKVYPNPTQGNLKIDLGEKYAEINAILFDAQGKLITEFTNTNQQSFELLIEGSRGMYILEIETTNGRKARVEILKE